MQYTSLIHARLVKLLKQRPWLLRLRSYINIRVRSDEPLLEGEDALARGDAVMIDWPSDVAKPRVGIVRDLARPPSWTKYRRFCSNNELGYDYLELHAWNWRDRARPFDMIVGHPSSQPQHLDELWRKTYILQTQDGKVCYPSLRDLVLYEDKHMQYETLRYLGFPVIATWVSCQEQDALHLLDTLHFPLISKLITGSGSLGVEMIKDKCAAQHVIRKAFSIRGRYFHWPFDRQKDYVLLQEFIPNDGYDIRAICIGNLIFGYFRKVRKGDFRASGSDLVEKRELPEKVIRIARQVATALNTVYLSVDFIRSSESGEYLITEIAHFNQIDSAEQLHVEGVPGAYVFDDNNQYTFKEGKVWPQELAMREVCKRYIGNIGSGGSVAQSEEGCLQRDSKDCLGDAML